MTENMRKIIRTAVAGTLAAGMIIGSAAGVSAADKIRVGSKGFTENDIVAEVYVLALENAGYEVERIFSLASSVIHTSIINGELDLYPEYTGTGLITILGMDPITDPEEVYKTVKEEYEKQFGVTWLDYSQANDGQGLMIRTETAEKYGIRTISDMQKMRPSSASPPRASLMSGRTAFPPSRPSTARLTGRAVKSTTIP